MDKVRTMKLITWNVNGLRAVLGKKGLDWAWQEKPDALCLQEIKSRPDGSVTFVFRATVKGGSK